MSNKIINYKDNNDGEKVGNKKDGIIDIPIETFKVIVGLFEKLITDGKPIQVKEQRAYLSILGAMNGILNQYHDPEPIINFYEWKEGQTSEECLIGAYWERNTILIFLGNALNLYEKSTNGWYHDPDAPAGWSRIISLDNGSLCFLIPDDFKIGDLFPEIEKNWNGHNTAAKWSKIMAMNSIPFTKKEDNPKMEYNVPKNPGC